MEKGKWQAVVNDFEQRARIDEILNLIVEKLDSINEFDSADLLSGSSGISIFYEYHYKYTGRIESRIRSNKLLLDSLKKIKERPLGYTFCTGISGILWSLTQLIKLGSIDWKIDEIVDEQIEALLVDYSVLDLERGNLDYLHGGIGTIIYFLERKTELSASCLKRFFELITKNSIEMRDGISWLDYNSKNSKSFNLGVAHGVPSILILMARIHQLNSNDKHTSQIIYQGIIWLLKQKNVENTFAEFPNSTAAISVKNSRLGWCYGDLGIAIILFQIGVIVEDELIQREGIRLGLKTVERKDTKTNQINDAGFCHGTTGIAHIYNRFFQYTGIEIFKEASNFWFLNTIEMFEITEGFCSWRLNNTDGTQYWDKEFGILEGLSGIGLTLISAVTNFSPDWDRSLLIS